MQVLKFILGSLTLCISLQTKAIILLFSDYDNTITKDREDGNWVTFYELHRVHSTALSAIPVPLDQPKKLLISHKDWEDYEASLAAGDGHTGSMLSVALHHGETLGGQRVESFIPGFYQKVGSLTYSRYRGDDYFDPDVQDPINHWREDRKKAMALTEKNQGTHIGLGYDLATHFLKNPYLAAGFRLVTARGYPDAAIMEIFKDMMEDGEITQLPYIHPSGKPLAFWALGHPQFANRWSTHNIGKKKAAVIMEAANQWRMTPARERVLNPDGTAIDFYHTFIIQEDNSNYIDLFVKVAQEITRRGTHFIKFIIRHTGSQEEVEANRFFIMKDREREWIRDIVIKSDGSFRKASTEEMFIEDPLAKVGNERLLSGCQRLLEHGGK